MDNIPDYIEIIKRKTNGYVGSAKYFRKKFWMEKNEISYYLYKENETTIKLYKILFVNETSKLHLENLHKKSVLAEALNGSHYFEKKV
ncbi:hypothetical protein RCL_jg23946.t1 [Rhizophagus clarus]|uniref:Uncharacterized protein n=1 Tax=Rhizophagus clarus TaxID=94130 RepID=A0A8H3LKC3_9GLOM|nr:hypothetical protein RCL_jg23946.t1 [Rhizophagus clarus]